jgi:hypothetical protein
MRRHMRTHALGTEATPRVTVPVPGRATEGVLDVRFAYTQAWAAPARAAYDEVMFARDVEGEDDDASEGDEGDVEFEDVEE